MSFSQRWMIYTLLAALSTGSAWPQILYTDVSVETGVAVPGVLTESVAWGDYDGDGDEDLYLTNVGPNRLLRNDGGDTFVDVTSTVGVGDPGWSVGAAFGDLDNDGDLDLYVVSFNSGPDVLYRNDGPVGPGGETVYTNVTPMAGITHEESSRGVALIDFDRDSLLDIYVNAIGLDIVYYNDGSLVFESAAEKLGVQVPGLGVGVVATDVDNDGWIDLFTGNRSFDPNRLLLNQGDGFADVTFDAGIDVVGLGMGVIAFDYDNDLDMDLYWTVWPGGDPPTPNALYENQGDGTFVDVAAASGTKDPLGWGISVNTGDVDNDGWEDFFVTNGFDPSSTKNVLFRNQGDGTFADISDVLGDLDYDGRGVAFADYDNDGDLDLCVTSGETSVTRLWRNDSVHANHWLTLHLVGTRGNRSAIGSRIEVETDLGAVVKEVSGGAGRGSQNSLPVEFGLGEASEIRSVRVRWPGGGVQSLGALALDQHVVVVEEEPALFALPLADFKDPKTASKEEFVHAIRRLALGKPENCMYIDTDSILRPRSLR